MGLMLQVLNGILTEQTRQEKLASCKEQKMGVEGSHTP